MSGSVSIPHLHQGVGRLTTAPLTINQASAHDGSTSPRKGVIYMQQLDILINIFFDIFGVMGSGLIVAGLLSIVLFTLHWYFQTICGLRVITQERRRLEERERVRASILDQMIDEEIANRYPHLMIQEIEWADKLPS